MSKNSFSMVLAQRIALAIFLTGKVVRFVFFFLFLFFILEGTNSLAGYTQNQALFFFLIFALVDTLSQFLFREVYRFRPLIVKGDFDYVMVKPVNPLFRVLMGGADVIDLITLPPLIFVVFKIGSLLDPSTAEVLSFLLLFVNGMLITTAFHITVLSLGILTTEIDHTVMIYRDLMSLGRFPVDIYREPLRGILTYIVPVGIMVTLPAKALIGLVSPIVLVMSVAVGFLFIFLSIKFWDFALTKYTSASS